MKIRRNRRGSSLIEFALVGIPAVFLVTSVFDAGIDLWQYFSVAYGAEVTSRYAGMHGASCSQNGNACTTTIGALVAVFTHNAPAVNTGDLNITFTDSSGTTQCHPVTNCATSTAQFPATSGSANAVGKDVVVSATFPLTLPISMFWAGGGSTGSQAFVVGATSRQEIVF